MLGQNCRSTKTLRHTVAAKKRFILTRCNKIPFLLHMSIIFFILYLFLRRSLRLPPVNPHGTTGAENRFLLAQGNKKE